MDILSTLDLHEQNQHLRAKSTFINHLTLFYLLLQLELGASLVAQW